MNPADGKWPQTFKQVYCEKFHCPEAAYETSVFSRCLYRHALPVAAWIYRRNPEFFREDLDLIREVGNVNNPATFRNELNFFYGRNLRDRNWVRRCFCLRLSAKRFLKLKGELFATETLD